MFHARDGAIFSKNSTFVFFDGASPITENGIQLRSPSPIMAPDLNQFKRSPLVISGEVLSVFPIILIHDTINNTGTEQIAILCP